MFVRQFMPIVNGQCRLLSFKYSHAMVNQWWITKQLFGRISWDPTMQQSYAWLKLCTALYDTAHIMVAGVQIQCLTTYNDRTIA